MAIQVRHKKPLRHHINLRLCDDHMAQYESHGGVLYIRALIDADIAKEARRAKARGIKNEKK